MAMNQTSRSSGVSIPSSDMTDVLGNATLRNNSTEEGDIPVSEINITDSTVLPGGNFAATGEFPQILPNSPTFTVPANPLLPDEYSEVLDYNYLQYMNGIFRTQIGRFVRVQQLIGSNTIQDVDGFLIGVGINYIILQEYSNQDIRILDIYGIKQMYVYYSEIAAPYLR